MPRKKPATPKAKKPLVRDKRRIKAVPLPAGPLVPMPMPWVQSEQGVTVSYVCPTCRTRREITPAHAQELCRKRHVPLSELACSVPCREQWLALLMAAIEQSGQTYVLKDQAWIWELYQGVVGEVLAEPLQERTLPQRKAPWQERTLALKKAT